MIENQPMTLEDWQELREQIFVLLDVTWDYSVNVATLEQMSVKRNHGEPLEEYNKRAHEVYQKRFREIKSDSFERLVKVLGYLKRLGMPKEFWPKEMEISNITGEKTG